MRNERQVSVLSVEELSEVAGTMGIAKFEPGWIGANIVLEDIPSMTFLPSRTLLFFEGGVTLRIDGANGPCRIAGGEIARALGASGQDGTVDEKGSDFDWTRTDMALDFVEAARMKRGLVAWVEREGVIRPGEEVTVRIWEQWIY
jgi:MOSC domain-containing protein YiiM